MALQCQFTPGNALALSWALFNFFLGLLNLGKTYFQNTPTWVKELIYQLTMTVYFIYEAIHSSSLYVCVKELFEFWHDFILKLIKTLRWVQVEPSWADDVIWSQYLHKMVRVWKRWYWEPTHTPAWLSHEQGPAVCHVFHPLCIASNKLELKNEHLNIHQTDKNYLK